MLTIRAKARKDVGSNIKIRIAQNRKIKRLSTKPQQMLRLSFIHPTQTNSREIVRNKKKSKSHKTKKEPKFLSILF